MTFYVTLRWDIICRFLFYGEIWNFFMFNRKFEIYLVHSYSSGSKSKSFIFPVWVSISLLWIFLFYKNINSEHTIFSVESSFLVFIIKPSSLNFNILFFFYKYFIKKYMNFFSLRLILKVSNIFNLILETCLQ